VEERVLPTAEAIDLKNHPILITLQDTISGNGFLARITVAGRTLMRQEDDGKWWMYGVRPAAIAESGSTVDEAFLRFKQAHTHVLLDMVQESKSFDEFRTEVERFFNAKDVDEAAWEEALKAVRDGHAAPPEPFYKLPRQSPDSRPARIEVERLDGKITPFTVRDNATITYSIADKEAA
jgi:predicted RNase H-like HicB family nuclease